MVCPISYGDHKKTKYLNSNNVMKITAAADKPIKL